MERSSKSGNDVDHEHCAVVLPQSFANDANGMTAATRIHRNPAGVLQQMNSPLSRSPVQPLASAAVSRRMRLSFDNVRSVRYLPGFKRRTPMKFAICQELFESTPWEDQCRVIADIGYTGVELAPFSITDDLASVPDSRLAHIRSVATNHGLEIIGLHWLLAKTEGLHLTSPDPDVQARTVAYLRLLARTCAALGGRVLVFGSPQQRNLLPEVSTEQAMEIAASVFREATAEFAACDVRLCMEPLTKKETDFVNTCAEAVELIQRVDHPSFVLHQDVKAMLGAESDSVVSLIHQYRDICGHFHVNDTNLLGPGMGETDFAPILQALYDVDYSGWVSVEVFDYSPGAEQIARQSLQCMQHIVASL